MKNRLLTAVVCFTALMLLTSTTLAAEKHRVEVKAKSASQSAEHRIALVIGNANYRIGALRNPANDARAIAAALRELGFEVDEQINLSYQEMGRAVDRFGKGIRKDSVALFYYAGHGLQVQGKNYLVPVDMEIQDEGEVQFSTVNAGQVLAKMGEVKNPVNIVILDACWDNPYVRGFKRSSGNRGLAPMDAPVGSFVAYAATPGKTAGDGKGKNSLYTESLIRQIRTPGMKIEDVFKRVRTEVRSKSKGGQAPLARSSLEGNFYFASGSVVAKVTPATSAVKETASGMPTVKSNVSDAKTISIVMEKSAPLPAEARTFTSPTLGATFALIPAGTFTMGSPAGESGRYDNETQHQVTISRPFYLQTTEVTQGQWQQVMGNNPSYFKKCGTDCPVEKVSWNDVQEFIRKLNSMEGTDKYRLPTEAQWEYAARAGTQTPFSTGDCLAISEANYNGNHPLEGCTEGGYRQKTMRGGSFAPNAWGLYDMHGNVLEWVKDWYGNYPSGRVSDPEGPSSGSGRVSRGGSWFYSARNIRSAYRDRDFPGYCYSFLGFRLLRTR